MTTLRSSLNQLRKLGALRKWFTGNLDRLVLYTSVMGLQSDVPIDVVVPAAEKDADVLPYAIAGIRRNIRHPIVHIYVVGEESERLRSVCRKSRAEYVDELDVVPMSPSSIGLEVNGIDRSRWIYQQFLKLSGDRFVTQEHYLVVDADTVMIRPQVFERKGRLIYNYSDEYHRPYFDMYERLLGERPACPVSFTSHQMLFSVGILGELKAAIEAAHRCPWEQAILKTLDRSELSGCSDYDTYGQFAFLHYAERIAIEYWFNIDLSRRELRQLPLLELKYGGRYKSASFHSYRR